MALERCILPIQRAVRDSVPGNSGCRSSWTEHVGSKSQGTRKQTRCDPKSDGKKLLEKGFGPADWRVQRHGRGRGQEIRAAVDELRPRNQRGQGYLLRTPQ
eukprot:scaffold840_cov344-Pavlova_lutheri.AAC.81